MQYIVQNYLKKDLWFTLKGFEKSIDMTKIRNKY